MQIQDWNNLGQMAAEASSTLLGLLFVAVSLNRDRIMKYPSLRARAIETLLLFMLPLLASILLAIPGQSMQLLGGEFLLLAALRGVALVFTGRARKKPGRQTRLNRLFGYTSPALITLLLVVICGLTLIAGRVSGLYWLVAAIILALVGGVANAWIFLVADPDVEARQMHPNS